MMSLPVRFLDFWSHAWKLKEPKKLMYNCVEYEEDEHIFYFEYRAQWIPNKSRLTRLTLTTWGLTLNWDESNSLPSTASTSTTPPSPPPPPRRPRAQSWRASHRPAQVEESWEKLKSQVGPIQLGPNWESVPVISHPSCIRIMGCAIWIQNFECQITNQ